MSAPPVVQSVPVVAKNVERQTWIAGSARARRPRASAK